MRKLKLEMQMSIDGFAADNKSKLDWMVWDWSPHWNWDQELKRFHTELQTSSDSILLGKRMGAGDFLEHWKQVASDRRSSQHQFAKAIVEMKKYVFSKRLSKTRWENTEIINEDLKPAVTRLKAQKGKDIIVYGGTSFVSSLIKEDLIDEYNLIINPSVLGTGKPIFKKVPELRNLSLISATTHKQGIVLMRYKRKA